MSSCFYNRIINPGPCLNLSCFGDLCPQRGRLNGLDQAEKAEKVLMRKIQNSKENMALIMASFICLRRAKQFV
ncbi:Hypothetical predicted protein [Podarcis lilfordi]|uniref:Uncharacterized protein n=1 Tax=Podarcis lilfordi TaxID=74358 RepID=A0AA35JZW1_9SAUR|nr:Hypothetical predicted protein [Podarcis lilfordi]